MHPDISVHFITLGCPKNEVDSDRMSAALAASSGFGVSSDLESADITVLNTCAFITDAVEEAIAAIIELGEWKAARPGRLVIVAGCLPSRYGETVEPEFPEVDAFVPVADEASLGRIIAGLTGGTADVTSPRLRMMPGPTAYLQISDGCHRRCAYCTIPAIRGPYRSTPLEDIIEEARFLVENGASELVLIGQDISAYGRDLSTDDDLPAVLRALVALPGDFRLRLMYVQPDGITDELLAVIAGSDKICRYLDMPLQHASRDVLRRMHRSGDADAFLALIGRVRSALPGISLRTTVMSGFPGETRQDARILETFLRDAEFDYVGVFAFSPEEGTEAGLMSDQVPRRTRIARAQRLRDIADTVGIERSACRMDDIVSVLFESVDEDGNSVGRTCGQAPEIDGEVIVESAVPVGIVRDARIIGNAGYDLIGELI